MFYSIRHLTKFRYSSPVSESIMELRMQPRSEGAQRCLSFEVTVTPRTRVQTYRDHLGNVVQHFDVHRRLRHDHQLPMQTRHEKMLHHVSQVIAIRDRKSTRLNSSHT